MKPEGIQNLLDTGLTFGTTTYVILFVVCAVSGFIGSYLSSYAKTKGKNFATKEDFENLKTQTKLLTEATEKVKSEVANSSWVESKKWELKFKIYTEVLEALAVWRISISKIDKEVFDSEGEKRKGFDKDKLGSVSEKIDVAFEGLAKIEAIAGIGLSKQQCERVRNLRDLATKGTEEEGLHSAFLSSIARIKALESELAGEAKGELFTD